MATLTNKTYWWWCLVIALVSHILLLCRENYQRCLLLEFSFGLHNWHAFMVHNHGLDCKSMIFALNLPNCTKTQYYCRWLSIPTKISVTCQSCVGCGLSNPTWKLCSWYYCEIECHVWRWEIITIMCSWAHNKRPGIKSTTKIYPYSNKLWAFVRWLGWNKDDNVLKWTQIPCSSTHRVHLQWAVIALKANKGTEMEQL